MNSPHKDAGIIAVLLQRLATERLPSMLRLKDKVDSGERLSDGEIEYLDRALVDAKDARLWPLLERHPEYEGLISTLFSFYRKIVDRAFENESRATQAGR